MRITDTQVGPECTVVYGYCQFVAGQKNDHRATGEACRATLLQLLSACQESPTRPLIFRKGPFGKPFIESSPTSFNVSHTNRAFLIAIHSRFRVGIDLEMLDGGEDLHGMADYAFSPEEQKEWSAGTPFLEIWTRKEALLKAAGLGLTGDLRAIDSMTCMKKWGLEHHTFTCPGGETACLVTKATTHEPV
jgi:4'-phosphopantetheinyl transferase